MRFNWVFVSAVIASGALAQQARPTKGAPAGNEMVVAVTRSGSYLTGGLGGARKAAEGSAYIEQIAWLSPSGDWKRLPCDRKSLKGCLQFEHDYLKKSHSYIVVSADGRGAAIHAEPTALSECYNYSGKGTYEGGVIRDTAIAADSTESFTEGESAKRITPENPTAILKAIAKRAPDRNYEAKSLRVYSVTLEGQSLTVVQHAFEDNGADGLLFGIGVMQEGQFQFQHWKADIDDEEERVLGVIHTKGGRDFLITSVSDPESQVFRIYGIHKGKLTMVFEGGGSSC